MSEVTVNVFLKFFEIGFASEVITLCGRVYFLKFKSPFSKAFFENFHMYREAERQE